ncbi:hypothetical protein VB773_01870 [Haloarculaceae archaeon H-GB2-1]|nr:hypothetical protein [Haloarculaceae archaeon H-GB11]MEA5406450.1 hypothetical protein [Haloarculaceae archaeon H-GB2-1]
MATLVTSSNINYRRVEPRRRGRRIVEAVRIDDEWCRRLADASDREGRSHR